jgi:hypothetical protein
LSPECPLNRMSWFMLHKLLHTKRFLLSSHHYRCVTSQTEREVEGGNALAHKTWNSCCFFPCGKLLCAFSKTQRQAESTPIILIKSVLLLSSWFSAS